MALWYPIVANGVGQAWYTEQLECVPVSSPQVLAARVVGLAPVSSDRKADEALIDSHHEQ